MVIKINGCHIEGCGVGISTDGSIDLDISETKIIGCQKAIEQRDRLGAFQAIGLPADTPPDLLIEALKLLLKYEDADPKQSAEALSKTKLFEWLSGTANTTTVLNNLFALQQNRYVQNFLQMIS